jgi:hypothetical protein
VALSHNVRLGGGVRLALDPRVTSSGDLSGNDHSLDARAGLIVEGEFFPLSRLGVKLRYVHETYRGTGSNANVTFDGSHAGIYATYYFN